MTSRYSSSLRRGLLIAGVTVSSASVLMTALILAVGGTPSAAAATSVGLGTARSFGVVAGSTVTNTGLSVVTGDLGVSPGTSVTGFPPGTVLGGIHAADALALQAQADVATAYDAVAAQATDETISDDLGGRTLTTGVYTSASTMGLTGELTLDAQGDPSAVFVFQVGSGLTTASGSEITLANGAQACNVFWQVGSSAVLGNGSTFIGTILALTSISAGTSATIDGRLLARTGAVTLDTNTVTVSTCATDVPTTNVPTTDVPTTDVPTTDVPTTDVPTTDVPTTDVPTSDVPTTDVPTTDGATSEGATSEGATSDAPTSDAPVTDVPTTEQPNAEQPPTDQVPDTPTGFPDTGDGGTADGSGPTFVGAGALALLLATGLHLRWRRETATG